MHTLSRISELTSYSLTAWLFLAAGCEFPGKPRPEDQFVPPYQIMTFDTLFQRNCVACHGADDTLGPAPPLNDKLFLALITDSELESVVSRGRPGTLMPAFETTHGGHLTAEQVRILARGIKQQWGAIASVSHDAPAYTATTKGNWNEGLKVYASACAACHGDHGQGGMMEGQRVGAINDPEYLRLISDQALRRIVITGRPDLGMPDYSNPKGRASDFKPLSSRDVDNLVALLAHWRTEQQPRKGNNP